MPPNVPRSRRWNHAALTLTIDTAPKLWKYMLSANSHSSAVHAGRVALHRIEDADRGVARRRAGRRDQHREPAAEPVAQRAVEQERQPVDDRADRVDRAEVLAADLPLHEQRDDVVAAHVEERVRQAERQPVRDPAAAIRGSVPDVDLRQPAHDDRDHRAQDEDRERPRQ